MKKRQPPISQEMQDVINLREMIRETLIPNLGAKLTPELATGIVVTVLEKYSATKLKEGKSDVQVQP